MARYYGSQKLVPATDQGGSSGENSNAATASSPALTERIRQILPEIAGRARETEQARQVLFRNIGLLHEIGYMRALVPASYGGGADTCRHAESDTFARVRLRFDGVGDVVSGHPFPRARLFR